MEKPNLIIMSLPHSGSSVITAMYNALGWRFDDNSGYPTGVKGGFELYELGVLTKIMKFVGYNDKVIRAMNSYKINTPEFEAEMGKLKKTEYGRNLNKLFNRIASMLKSPWVIKHPSWTYQCMPFFMSYFTESKPKLIWLQKDLELVRASLERDNHPKSRKKLRYCNNNMQNIYDSWPWDKQIVQVEDIKQAVFENNKDKFLKAMGIENFECDNIEKAMSLFSVKRNDGTHEKTGERSYNWNAE